LSFYSYIVGFSFLEREREKELNIVKSH